MDKELTDLQKKQLVSWFRMANIVNKTTQLSNEFLKQFDLTLAQIDTLSQIQRHEPLTQQELGQHLMVTGGGVSQMLRKLEDRGWITRRQEWKVKYIQVTQEGRSVLKKVQHLQGINQAKMFDGLSAEENDELENLLRKLQYSLSPESDETKS